MPARKGAARRGGRDHAEHAADLRPDLSRANRRIKEIMKRSRELGMQTFDQALFDLFEAQAITFEDALRNADSVNTCAADQAAQPARAQQRPGRGHGAPEIV